MKSSCCNVLCTDSDRLVDNGICGLVECSCRIGMERSNDDPCVFRKVVINLIVFVHVTT